MGVGFGGIGRGGPRGGVGATVGAWGFGWVGSGASVVTGVPRRMGVTKATSGTSDVPKATFVTPLKAWWEPARGHRYACDSVHKGAARSAIRRKNPP
ncbi:hypothetical protein GCM10027199_37820 [Amycolatopsis magusensis]